jgi:hypothetical protein
MVSSLGFGGGAVPDEGVVAPPMVEDKVESELDTGKKVPKGTVAAYILTWLVSIYDGLYLVQKFRSEETCTLY